MSQKFSGGLLRLFFKMLKWSKKFHSIKIFWRKRGCCRLLIPIALMRISEFFFCCDPSIQIGNILYIAHAILVRVRIRTRNFVVVVYRKIGKCFFKVFDNNGAFLSQTSAKDPDPYKFIWSPECLDPDPYYCYTYSGTSDPFPDPYYCCVGTLSRETTRCWICWR